MRVDLGRLGTVPIPDATLRFSTRVENYLRFRPGYPRAVLDLLRAECGWTPATRVADIASGTGIFTRMLLDNGNQVFGVEPNQQMRQAAEHLLASYPRFVSVNATAEATTLPDRSVELVTAAQAAHWFDHARARREFARIVTPGGWVVLLWNERSTDATPFLRAYEQLLVRYGSDYQQVRHEHTTDTIDAFFHPAPCRKKVFALIQEFDYAALEGRLLSSSYTPLPGHPNHTPMLEELQRIFQAHASAGKVLVPYHTRVYYGQLT
jgi:ubiquinone/menaquinone biosynthesis C-methylase UbiE